jgi:hypothetical protein
VARHPAKRQWLSGKHPAEIERSLTTDCGGALATSSRICASQTVVLAYAHERIEIHYALFYIVASHANNPSPPCHCPDAEPMPRVHSMLLMVLVASRSEEDERLERHTLFRFFIPPCPKTKPEHESEEFPWVATRMCIVIASVEAHGIDLDVCFVVICESSLFTSSSPLDSCPYDPDPGCAQDCLASAESAVMPLSMAGPRSRYSDF